MARKPNSRRGRWVTRQWASRPKLDHRLALLLSLPDRQRRALKAQEDDRLFALAKEITAAKAALDQAKESERKRAVERLRGLNERLFAPLTTGFFLPPAAPRDKAWPARMKESYVGAFILSEASASDLENLGVLVRSQAGDVFSAFIPLSVIPRLERSAAVRYIELARPLFPALTQAVPYAQINALHSAVPAINGTGVIVGVIDDVLDVHHPDFQSAANATRVLFLWDQNKTPQGAEAGPSAGGAAYGVEYDQANINNELASLNPPTVPAYQTVRHGGAVAAHGTHVAGIAVGNGRGQANLGGAAPAADLIFVASAAPHDQTPITDSTFVADAFAYIFAHAAARGQPCVANMSNSDNQGAHDGSSLGEQFLDNLLLIPGRAITLSAGNSNNTASHAAGTVPAGGTTNLVLNYRTVDVTGDGVNDLPTASDSVEIWYDGHDRFNVTITIPSAPQTVIGPVTPGNVSSAVLPNGVQVQVASVLNDPRNGDNVISLTFVVAAGQSIPLGNTIIALSGAAVINGGFHAWVDRNNRLLAVFRVPLRQEGTLTLGVPATARRAITVGNHNKAVPTPTIHTTSGCGPSRDGRIKPEIATVGMDLVVNVTGVIAPASRNMNAAAPTPLYTGKEGTSMSAPLVAGACACLLQSQCRGPATTWANLKQILEDTAGTTGLAIPSNSFGFGFMQIASGCAAPAPAVDVWLRDHTSDTGTEPFTGAIAWLSPDIEVLDDAGNTVANPTFHPTKRFNNIIRVTVGNRGTRIARNTEVHFYWADPATNIPYPAAWNATGIYNDAPAFVNQSNMIVIPQLAPGASAQVQFGWAPPAPGSNIRGDDHFCLLVRLENEGDPSLIGAGGWSAISSRNNVALRNLHVQPAGAGDAALTFYMVGSADQDSLIVHPVLAGGRVRLWLPVQALPWRDLKLIERMRSARPEFGRSKAVDPLAAVKATLKGDQVRALTDIVGAQLLELRDGIATVTLGAAGRLQVPHVRLAEGVRMVARVEVSRPKVEKGLRFVHVAQHSGGQLVGGVSLELRPRRS